MWRRYVQGNGPKRGQEPPSLHYIVEKLGLLKDDCDGPLSDGDYGLDENLTDLEIAVSPIDAPQFPSQPVSPLQEDTYQ